MMMLLKKKKGKNLSLSLILFKDLMIQLTRPMVQPPNTNQIAQCNKKSNPSLLVWTTNLVVSMKV